MRESDKTAILAQLTVAVTTARELLARVNVTDPRHLDSQETFQELCGIAGKFTELADTAFYAVEPYEEQV